MSQKFKLLYTSAFVGLIGAEKANGSFQTLSRCYILRLWDNWNTSIATALNITNRQTSSIFQMTIKWGKGAKYCHTDTFLVQDDHEQQL